MNQLTYRTSGRKGLYLSATFLLALTISTGCKKETNTLGLGALDPNELLESGGVDTFQLTTYTVEEDSLPTDNQLFVLLGNYQDPKFGTFEASFFTQFHLNGTIDFNGGTPVIDSAVLSLAYRRSYGKTGAQDFHVYRLGESLHIDSTYYRSSSISPTGGQLVVSSSINQVPNLTDSVLVDGDMRPPQLRLQLENSVFQQFLDDAVSAPSNFDTDEHFTEYFKGLHVLSTSSPSANGGVFSFNLADADTRLTIYYKIDGVQFTIELNAEASCADFNRVLVSNPGEISSTFDNPTAGSSQFYAQSFSSRGKVDFAGVDGLPKNCIIHDALLVVPVVHQTSAIDYAPPVALSAGYLTDEDGVVGFKVMAYDDNTKSYIIDVRDYLQDVVTGEAENRGVFLYPTFFSATAERVIFNGRNTSNKYKPKLIIKYTEY